MEKALAELGHMDEMAVMDSPAHHLNAGAKLLATVIYIIVVMSFDKYNLSGLVPMLLWPVFMYQLSGIPVSTCFYKLRIVLPLVMAVGLFNPIFDREIMLYSRRSRRFRRSDQHDNPHAQRRAVLYGVVSSRCDHAV